MTGLTLDDITTYWSNQILQDQSAIAIDRLKSVNMPAYLKSYVLQHGKIILDQEIDRILSSPYFDLANREDSETDLNESLSKFLMDRMILPESSIHDMVLHVYQKLLDEWEIAPLSMRQANDAPDELAHAVFERIAAIVPVHEDETQTHDLKILSQICQSSGLGPLASAVQLESKLGVTQLTLSQFVKIIRRLVMLKDHFKVSGRMIASEGTTVLKLDEPGIEDVLIQPLDDVTEDMLPEPDRIDSHIPDSVAVMEDIPEPDTEIEDLPDSVQLHELPEELPETTDEPITEPITAPELVELPEEPPIVDKPVEVKKTVVQPVEDSGRSPFLSPELTTSHKEGASGTAPELKIHSEVVPPDPPAPSPDLTDSGRFMFSQLMHPQKRAFLGNKLFDDDFGSYDRMVNKICLQKTVNHALVIADNELYIHDIEVTAIPAAELLRTIKTYFGESEHKN